jgi:hypothetical protein
MEFRASFFEKRKPTFTDVLSKNAPRTYPWWTELSVQNRAQSQASHEKL